MKKILAIAVATALLGGCSTFGDKDPIDQVNLNTTEAEFLSENGGLEIEFTDSGEWVKITSTGVAQIQTDRINSTEEAFSTAELRAKGLIVEFIAQDVKSSKTVDGIAQQYLNENAGVDPTKSDEVSRKVTESISSDAETILRGVTYGDRDYNESSRMVSVELVITKQSVTASKKIFFDMKLGARQ